MTTQTEPTGLLKIRKNFLGQKDADQAAISALYYAVRKLDRLLAEKQDANRAIAKVEMQLELDYREYLKRHEPWLEESRRERRVKELLCQVREGATR